MYILANIKGKIRDGKRKRLPDATEDKSASKKSSRTGHSGTNSGKVVCMKQPRFLENNNRTNDKASISSGTQESEYIMGKTEGKQLSNYDNELDDTTVETETNSSHFKLCYICFYCYIIFF